MSSCAASCCIFSPRALFASATSASSPIGGAPLSYRFASKHSTQFHRRPNQKHPPLRNRARFGVVPSVVDPWRSWNDLPLPKSNSVLHRCWALLLHETACQQPENSARFTALRPRVPRHRTHHVVPRVYIRRSATVPCLRHPWPSTRIPSSHPGIIQNSFCPALNAHRPASAANDSGFLLTALSNARHHTAFRVTTLGEGAPPKKH